jgi:hypothetical protein
LLKEIKKVSVLFTIIIVFCRVGLFLQELAFPRTLIS